MQPQKAVLAVDQIGFVLLRKECRPLVGGDGQNGALRLFVHFRLEAAVLAVADAQQRAARKIDEGARIAVDVARLGVGDVRKIGQVDAEDGVGQLDADGGAHPGDVLFKADGGDLLPRRGEVFQRGEEGEVVEVEDVQGGVLLDGGGAEHGSLAPRQGGDDAQRIFRLVHRILIMDGAGDVRAAAIREPAAAVRHAGDLGAALAHGARHDLAARLHLRRIAARQKDVVLRDVHLPRKGEERLAPAQGEVLAQAAEHGVAGGVGVLAPDDVLHRQALERAGRAELGQELRLVREVGVAPHGEVGDEQKFLPHHARGDVAAREIHAVRLAHLGGVGHVDGNDGGIGAAALRADGAEDGDGAAVLAQVHFRLAREIGIRFGGDLQAAARGAVRRGEGERGEYGEVGICRLVVQIK